MLAEAVTYRVTVSGHRHANLAGFFGKMKSQCNLCNEAKRFLPLLQIPTERIKKTKVFERNFKCQIIDKKNTIRSKSILNQNTIKIYTDGSKLDGMWLQLFMQNAQTTPQNKHISTLEYITLCSKQKSQVFQKWQRTCFQKKKCTIKVLLCW